MIGPGNPRLNNNIINRRPQMNKEYMMNNQNNNNMNNFNHNMKNTNARIGLNLNLNKNNNNNIKPNMNKPNNYMNNMNRNMNNKNNINNANNMNRNIPTNNNNAGTDNVVNRDMIISGAVFICASNFNMEIDVNLDALSNWTRGKTLKEIKTIMEPMRKIAGDLIQKVA